jgi:ferritin-like protein
MHPATASILRHFRYEHLPEHLQRVSRRFFDLAQALAADLPDDPETTASLRKLLEAKDCAVRAAIAGTG